MSVSIASDFEMVIDHCEQVLKRPATNSRCR